MLLIEKIGARYALSVLLKALPSDRIRDLLAGLSAIFDTAQALRL